MKFTSPIRRFPDILVHQQLLSTSISEEAADSITEQLTIANDKKTASRESQAQAEMIFFSVYLHIAFGTQGLELVGMIQDVQEHVATVSVPSFGGICFKLKYHFLDNISRVKFYPNSNSVVLQARPRGNSKPKEKLIKTFDLIKMTIACPELDVMLEDPVSIIKVKFD